jgi:hypothetical protein
MKKVYVAFSSVVLFSLISTAFVSMKFHDKSSSGIVGQTGSPGEGTCSGCHAGGLSSTTVAINANPAFVGNEYVQGQTYTITINIDGSGYSKFGFGCEILHIGTNVNAGTMANAGPGVKFLNSGARKNAVQTTPKTGTNTSSFSFEWTAPTNGQDCKIYAVGNCVNGNGSTSGDFARATSLSLTTPTITSLAQPGKNVLHGFSVFPNPVQDKINVHYVLNEPKHVSIQLVSIGGELVAQLLEEEQQNDEYTKSFDIPSEIAPGVYFLKINTNGKTLAQRLVSIR